MIHDSNATVNPPCPRTDDRLGASCVTLLPRAAMHKITTLDDHWMARPRSIGTALLESDGHHAIVDPGPGSTLNTDRKSTRLNSSHGYISYAVFCLKKKKNNAYHRPLLTI